MMKSYHSVTHIQLLFVSGHRFFVWLQTSISLNLSSRSYQRLRSLFFALSLILFFKINAWLEESCGCFYFYMLFGMKDKSAKGYNCTCQMPYSSIMDDLQRDSDEEGTSELGLRVELPFLTGSNFKEFSISY